MNNRTKPLVAFGSVAVLMVGIGLIGWISIRNLAGRFERLYADNVEAAVRLSMAEDGLWELRYGLAQFMVVDTDGRRKIVEDQKKWYALIEENLKSYWAGNRTAEEQGACAADRQVRVFRSIESTRNEGSASGRYAMHV